MTTHQPKLSLVKAIDADKPYLVELRLLTMAEHFNAMGLNPTTYEHQLRVEYEFDSSFLIYCDLDKVGLLKYRESDALINLWQLQIHPNFQNLGIGASVLSELFKKGKLIQLSVLKLNPALALYQRLGFNVVSEDNYEFVMERDCSAK